eukprot:GHVS01080197.1.p1 GENE.GHVS01080197.1~~GHVS01080197.1.p1  ORF type:complete len:158 (-),score=18.87 GHVS01080197.1:104-577(-)
MESVDLPSYPVLFQVNCRVLLRELTDLSAGKQQCTLDDIPDVWIDKLADTVKPNILYLLGVWTTGEEGKVKARQVMEHVHLPHDHICSSPFAVTDYRAHPDFGGDEALARFRVRLSSRGICLLLDFVPNHVSIDHIWTTKHTQIKDFIMPGNQHQLA